MKKIISSSLILTLLFIAISCGQTAQTQYENSTTPKMQAVEEIDIEEEPIQAEIEEKALNQQAAEESSPADAEIPSELEPSKPKTSVKPKKSSITEPPKLEIKKKRVIVEERIPKAVKDVVKQKGNTRRTSIAPLPAKDKKKIALPSHKIWNNLLNIHVTSSGSVNYGAIKRKEILLDTYLKLLAENPVSSAWPRNEKMAYWINLYNAATVKLIVENYPTKSIQKLENGKPWDKKWIKSGNSTYSLNEIENSILRPRFKDARVHFAVNCAAQSCPRLMNKAFTASNLESLLEQNAKWFVNSKFNKISSKKVEISKIFKWYAVDFGNIVTYLNKYSTTEIDGKANVSYLEYDWNLNGR
jgi:hypothetical protein